MNKKVFRLKPEVRRMLQVCSLAKYIALAIGFTYFIAGVVIMDFGLDAFEISLFIDGFALIFGTIIDIAAHIIKWFATHRLICRVEEKQIEII